MRSLLENLKLRPWCIDRAIARSMRLGRGLRFSSNDRTDEVIRFFIMTIFYKKKHCYWSGSPYFTPGDARAYQFIYQFKPIADQTSTGELSKVTRVLNCQDRRFTIVKNDYSKAVESNLLSEENLKNFAQGSQESAPTLIS